MFPSFFSHNAADSTYWTRPEIYNRDRHLFKKYLPTAQRLAAAGWEPLTGATTDNPRVYLERWGRGDNVYFTLFNDSSEPQAYTLNVDQKRLGTKLAGLQDAIDHLLRCLQQHRRQLYRRCRGRHRLHRQGPALRQRGGRGLRSEVSGGALHRRCVGQGHGQ